MKIMLTQPEEEKKEELRHFYKKQDLLRDLILNEENAFSLTQNPKEANYILFIGGINGEHNEYIIRNRIFKNYKKKCYVISDSGFGLKSVKGIYTSLSNKEYNKSIHEAGWYFPMDDLSEYAEENNIKKNCNILCSFRGDINTHPVRRIIHELMTSKASKNYQSTNTESKQITAWIKYDLTEINLLKKSYIQEILNSNFVLCPRGYNTSSMRIYEVMSLGRVPVIISDQWVKPEGPNWEKFCIFIKENEVERLEEIIDKYKNKSLQMGRIARREWELWFSNSVYASNILNKIESLSKRKRNFIPYHYLPLLNIKYLYFFLKSFSIK